jgi:hypothetical protein
MILSMNWARPSLLNVEICLRLANKAHAEERLCRDPKAKQFLLNTADAYEMLAIMKLSLERDAVLMAQSDKLLREA